MTKTTEVGGGWGCGGVRVRKYQRNQLYSVVHARRPRVSLCFNQNCTNLETFPLNLNTLTKSRSYFIISILLRNTHFGKYINEQIHILLHEKWYAVFSTPMVVITNLEKLYFIGFVISYKQFQLAEVFISNDLCSNL